MYKENRRDKGALYILSLHRSFISFIGDNICKKINKKVTNNFVLMYFLTHPEVTHLGQISQNITRMTKYETN